MSKKTKQSQSFFKGADLRLNRDIKREREKAEGPKPGAKGFMQELARKDEVRTAHTKAKAKGDEAALFRGETIATPKDAIEELKLDKHDPTKGEEADPNKGFSNQINWQADIRGIK